MMATPNGTSFAYGLISCGSGSLLWCFLLHLALLVVTVVTVAGNLLVIVSIGHFAQLRSPTNRLVLSLAVADLLIGLVVFPVNMPFSLRLCVETLSAFCRLRFALDFMMSAASVLSLCCISIDRYHAVCRPLTYRSAVTDRVVGGMVAATWLAALLCGASALALVSSRSCGDVCFALICGLALLTFSVPSAALVCVYLLIFAASRDQARSIRNAGAAKATKTLAIVMGLFLVCWTPLFLAYPFQALGRVAVNLVEPLNWFALSNSMYNPFIYAFFYKWYRAAFRMIVSGKIFRGNLAHANLH